MDRDEENQRSSNYQPPTQRAPTSTDFNCPYFLRNHILYLAKEYNELEILYREAREELERVKLSM